MEALVSRPQRRIDFVETKPLSKSVGMVRLYCFVVALFPILDLYTTSFYITFGEIALFACTVFLFAVSIVRQKKTISNRRYLLFLVYAVCISLMAVLLRPSSSGTIVRRIARDIVYGVNFLFLGSYFFDLRTFKKIYFVVIYFVFATLVVQYAAHFLIGKNIYFYINTLRLNYAESDAMSLIAARDSMLSFRPSSIFFEPAHLVEYSFVALPLSLFDKNKNMARNIIITAILFLSTSTTGMIVAGLAWIVWLFVRFRKNFFAMGFFCLVFLAILLFVLAKNNYLNKIAAIFEIDSYSSGSLRVARGFLLFDQLDWKSKVFGVGFGGFESYSQTYGLSKILSTQYVDYMSGISYVLVSSGIIGLLLYIFALFKGFFVSNAMHRSLVILVVVVLFVSQVYIAAVYLIYMLVINASSARNHENN